MIVDSSWQEIIDSCLNSLDSEYLRFLHVNKEYFPDRSNFLNAFKSLPREKTKAILFGQDPYPREKSAIGYAFIDAMVDDIFSQNGFSKSVNRATSLRNFLKMQLKAEGFLSQDVSQKAIASLEKDRLISSIMDLKNNFEKEGILLLNRALIFTKKEDTKLHVKMFKPFMQTFLKALKDKPLELILFGNEAKNIERLLPKNHNFTLIKSMHPYNVSFINDNEVISYFACKKLLKNAT